MGIIEYSDKVADIFDRHILRNGGEYSVCTIMDALAEVCEMYDKQIGSYPENPYAGFAFLRFCQGKPEPCWEEYRDYDRKIGGNELR